MSKEPTTEEILAEVGAMIANTLDAKDYSFVCDGDHMTLTIRPPLELLR